MLKLLKYEMIQSYRQYFFNFRNIFDFMCFGTVVARFY